MRGIKFITGHMVYNPAYLTDDSHLYNEKRKYEKACNTCNQAKYFALLHYDVCNPIIMV